MIISQNSTFYILTRKIPVLQFNLFTDSTFGAKSNSTCDRFLTFSQLYRPKNLKFDVSIKKDTNSNLNNRLLCQRLSTIGPANWGRFYSRFLYSGKGCLTPHFLRPNVAWTAAKRPSYKHKFIRNFECRERDRLPCWPLYSQQVSHKKSTQALKPRVDVIRSPKQGCQWPHKKDSFPTNLKKKQKQ